MTRPIQPFRTRAALFVTVLNVTTVAFSCSAVAHPDDYIFISVADSAGPLGPNFQHVAINDAGVISFYNTKDNLKPALFTATAAGGRPTLLVTTEQGVGGPQGFTILSAASSINNAGVVVFNGTHSVTGEGVFTIDGGGAFTVVANDDNSFFYDFGALPTINDAGDVAFSGNLYNPCCQSAMGLNGAQTYNVDGDFNLFSDPTMNNAGMIAFRADIEPGFSTFGIFSGSADGSTAATLIADTATFSSFSSPLEINDVGDVLFAGTLTSGVKGVFKWAEGSGAPTPVVTDAGPFKTFSAQGLGFNESGDIAFYGSLDDFVTLGIFTGPDPVADRVIATTDTLFGSPIYSLTFNRGMNSDGDIAFGYVLKNGSGGPGVGGVAVAKRIATAIPGDVNGDGVVDGADLGLLLAAWGACPAPPQGCPEDLNGDGVVDGADLGLLLAAWTG